MNRASLDRGFGRCIVLRKYGTSLKKYANRTQVGDGFRVGRGRRGTGSPPIGTARRLRLMACLPPAPPMIATPAPPRPAPQDRIVLPAAAAGPGPASARPPKFRLLDRDGIAAAGEILTQGAWRRGRGVGGGEGSCTRARRCVGWAGPSSLPCLALPSASPTPPRPPPPPLPTRRPRRRGAGEQADPHQHARPGGRARRSA